MSIGLRIRGIVKGVKIAACNNERNWKNYLWSEILI